MVRLAITSILLLGLSGLAGLFLALSAPQAARDPDLFLKFNVGALLIAGTQAILLVAIPLPLFRKLFPVLTLATFAATPVLVTTGFASGGPALGIVAVSYIQGALVAYYALRLGWAVAYSAVMLGFIAFVLRHHGDWVAPLGMWVFIAGNVVATGVLVGQLAATLNDRVTAQVSEIGRLNRLRRFLSPQVAEAVLSGQETDVTQPHRRRIAVLFCDLRGFTAFTNSAEPEEVIGVLDEYYRAVGTVLHDHDATIGDYAGDGIMAYVGDPVPRDDAAIVAVKMTGAIVEAMSAITAEWKRRGYDLDYGIGIAYGYATLGIVGFDGRYDYTPIGGVVNLAARLCAKAGPSQVLLDHATHIETIDAHVSEPVPDLELKGYGTPQRVYALV
jgi:class 3 adenylate cyclase